MTSHGQGGKMRPEKREERKFFKLENLTKSSSLSEWRDQADGREDASDRLGDVGSGLVGQT